jgi:hypothetical protein
MQKKRVRGKLAKSGSRRWQTSLERDETQGSIRRIAD